MKKTELKKRFKLLYFAAVNLKGMPDSFLDKLDELYERIEDDDPQAIETFKFYEKAIIDAIESLEIEAPFSTN